MSELKDSGARREFSTGAVRDIAEGKGRCDLLPLDSIANMSDEYDLLRHFEYFRVDRNIFHLNRILHLISDPKYMIGKVGRPMFKNSSEMLLEVSRQYEDGAAKYSERNWQQGIDLHCFIDSGTRHYIKWVGEWDDEPHDRAFVWNILGAMWTYRHKPELDDYCSAEYHALQQHTENNPDDLDIICNAIDNLDDIGLEYLSNNIFKDNEPIPNGKVGSSSTTTSDVCTVPNDSYSEPEGKEGMLPDDLNIICNANVIKSVLSTGRF